MLLNKQNVSWIFSKWAWICMRISRTLTTTFPPNSKHFTPIPLIPRTRGPEGWIPQEMGAILMLHCKNLSVKLISVIKVKHRQGESKEDLSPH